MKTQNISRREFNKKAGLAGLALAIGGLGILESCATYPKFFICNELVDNNQDGYADYSEYKNKKDVFRANEKITLVAETQNKKGYTLITKVWNGKEKLVKTFEDPISYNRSHVWNVFNPLELYEIGGQGLYRVEWSVEGQTIGTKEFELIK